MNHRSFFPSENDIQKPIMFYLIQYKVDYGSETSIIKIAMKTVYEFLSV